MIPPIKSQFIGILKSSLHGRWRKTDMAEFHHPSLSRLSSIFFQRANRWTDIAKSTPNLTRTQNIRVFDEYLDMLQTDGQAIYNPHNYFMLGKKSVLSLS